MLDTSWMAVGVGVFVAGGGYYTCVSVSDSQTAVLRNSGTSGNATAGATVAGSARIAAAGVPGSSGTAIPAPALVATSNIALTGIVTVDGVASNTVTGDILATAQTTSSQNGYWTPNAGDAWTRPSYYNSDATVAATLGQTSGNALGGSSNKGRSFYALSGATIAGAKVWIPGRQPAKINPKEAPWFLKLDGSDETTASDLLFGYCASLSASGGCYIEWPPGTLGRTKPVPMIQFCSHFGAGHFATVFTTLDVGQAPCDTLFGYGVLNVGIPGFLTFSNIKVVSAWSKTSANTWAPSSTNSASGAALVAGKYYFPNRYSNKMLKLITAGTTGAHPPIGELTPLNTPAMKLVGVPNAAAQVRVKIITGGALGVMTFQVSTAVGAASYGSTQTTVAGDEFTYIIPSFGGSYGIRMSNFAGGYTAAAVVSPTPRVVVLGTPPDDDYVVDINPSTIGALGTAAFGLGYGINTEKWQTGNVVSTVSTQTSSVGASWDYAIPSTTLTIRFYAGDYTNPGNTWKYFSPAAQWSQQDSSIRGTDGVVALTSDTNTRITDGTCVWEVIQGPACIGLYGFGNLTVRDIDMEGGTFGLVRSQAECVTIAGSWRANSQWGAADYQSNGDGRFGEYGQFTNGNHTGGVGIIFSLGWGVIDDGGIGYALDGAITFQRADAGFMFLSGRKGGTWLGSYLEAGRGLIRDCSYFSRCPVGKVRGMLFGGNSWSSVVSSTHTIDCSSGMVGCTFVGNEFGGSLYGLRGWAATIDCDASGNAHTLDQPIVDAPPFAGHVRSNQIDTLIAAVVRGSAVAVTGTTGPFNNQALPLSAIAEFSQPTSDYTVTGLVPAASGQRILLRNRTAFRMTLASASGSSTAGNRFTCPQGVDLVIAPGGWADVEKSASDAAWIIHSHSSTTFGANNTQAGTSYTATINDIGRCIDISSASAIALTVPPASSVPFPPGTVLTCCQTGAGQITWTQGAGVTINAPAGHSPAKSAAQYAHSSVRLTDTANVWIALGNLA